MSIGGESSRARGRPKLIGPVALSPGEYEVMELFWQQGPRSSRQVYEQLHASRSLAYTTVMTFLDKLCRKGFLSQEEGGKGSQFFPMVDRQEALQRCLDFFIRSYFGGTVANLLEFLGKDHPLPSLPAPPREKRHKVKAEKVTVWGPPLPTLDTELL